MGYGIQFRDDGTEKQSSRNDVLKIIHIFMIGSRIMICKRHELIFSLPIDFELETHKTYANAIPDFVFSGNKEFELFLSLVFTRSFIFVTLCLCYYSHN